jgi:hypothetical protein
MQWVRRAGREQQMRPDFAGGVSAEALHAFRVDPVVPFDTLSLLRIEIMEASRRWGGTVCVKSSDGLGWLKEARTTLSTDSCFGSFRVAAHGRLEVSRYSVRVAAGDSRIGVRIADRNCSPADIVRYRSPCLRSSEQKGLSPSGRYGPNGSGITGRFWGVKG